jgi:hypothetical protein
MTPVIYYFLPGKSRATYTRFFTLIKDQIADFGLVFSPTRLFTDYFADQRVEGDRSLWNHYGTEGPHTTNNIEGWHSKLKKMTQHAHSNIYTAIQLFKDIQNSIEITTIQRAVGGTIRPRAKKYLNIDRRLATLKDRYQTGVIDLITYADSASQLLH